MNSFLSRKALSLYDHLTNRQILKCLDDLSITQWLSQEELLDLQKAKLQRLVDYAYRFIPYYQRTFDEVGFKPEDLKQDITSLQKIPILTKDSIRSNFNAMLTVEPIRRKHMSKLTTSGSTGKPLIFMQDTDFRDHVTADTQRHMGWAGWQVGNIHALIWGARYKSNFRNRLRSQLVDLIWNRFQINAYSMTYEAMNAFTERIKKDRPRVLFGYATCVKRYAQFIRNSHYKNITFNGIFTSAEMLIPPDRDYIEKTFSCRVFNRYGTLELGGVACECEAHTGLHISAENNYVEIISEKLPVGRNEVGDIIVTNLNNLGMPFIRYKVGDAGSWYAGGKCPCGREYPMLNQLEGRIGDVFLRTDGQKIWTGLLSAALNCLAHPSIVQYQIVQKSMNKTVVRIVKDGAVPESTTVGIVHAIQAAIGNDVEVSFEYLQEIPCLPSGKYQFIMSEVHKG